MDDTTQIQALKDTLEAKGEHITGPHSGHPSPEWDYLELPERGWHVHIVKDGYGIDQALIYDGKAQSRAPLVRIADPDGSDWPGDPV